MIEVTNSPATAGSRPSWRTWIGRIGAGWRRPAGVNRIDPETMPAALLRDIGLCDGRGPSLRRPERVE
jgi:hypothetical protein